MVAQKKAAMAGVVAGVVEKYAARSDVLDMLVGRKEAVLDSENDQVSWTLSGALPRQAAMYVSADTIKR